MIALPLPYSIAEWQGTIEKLFLCHSGKSPIEKCPLSQGDNLVSLSSSAGTVTLDTALGLCWGPHYPGSANLESPEAKQIRGTR